MKDSQQNRQDCEQFLRAFEKPTQIYRYLRMRREFSPTFLQRNLSYLKGRIAKRTFNRREKKPFHWETFLKELKPVKNNEPNDNFLIFKFLGYFDKEFLNVDTATATIEIHLISKSRQQPKLLLKSIPVVINPRVIRNTSPIAISKEQLLRYTMEHDRTCILLIEVSCVEHQNNDERSQRSKKRRKISHEARLPVYNKKGHSDLLEGEYELKLDARTEMAPIRKVDHLTWANDIPKVLSGDRRYFDSRSLKFFLQWSTDDGTKLKSTSSIDSENASDTSDWCGIQTGSTTSLSTSSGILSDMSSDDTEITTLTTKKLPNTLPNELLNRSPFTEILNMNSHLIYRFIYNDNLSQKTEACDEFLCPWCYLNCTSLHPLLMHLRLCHDRFIFSYTPKEHVIQVDVSINDRYNCSLSSVLNDKSEQLCFTEKKPYKRKPYTKMLVSRQRAKESQSCVRFEDLDRAFSDSSDIEEDKFASPKGQLKFDGHDRQYYRTINNLMFTHQVDFDDDSEGEMDPDWLKNHTKKLIDEFSDVNEGEKEMLEMWNLHVMKHNFVGYCQMSLACQMFVDEKGDEIWSKNIYRNFVLHLTNLYDYDMLTPNQMDSIVEKLLAKKKQTTNEESAPI